jgi:hypothetical protein
VHATDLGIIPRAFHVSLERRSHLLLVSLLLLGSRKA